MSHEMPNLLGVWVGESVNEYLSECAVKHGPSTVYSVKKLIIEDTSIREIVDFVSVGEYDKDRARKLLAKLSKFQFVHPINDELQEGYHVAIFEFDVDEKVFMPANFDITNSGMDLRRRIVSLTKNRLTLETRIEGSHLDSDCANKVAVQSVFHRIGKLP